MCVAVTNAAEECADGKAQGSVAGPCRRIDEWATKGLCRWMLYFNPSVSPSVNAEPAHMESPLDQRILSLVAKALPR